MPWPNSRLTSYAAGTQIRSADLNQLQDAIIGGKHGERPLVLHAADGRAVAGTPRYVSPYVQASAINQVWDHGVPIHVGDVIRSVTWHFDRRGGRTVLQLRRVDLATGAVSDVATRLINVGTGVGSRLVPSVNHLVPPASAYFLRWVSGSAQDRYYGARIVYDHP